MKMDTNLDLGEFGICGLKCKNCDEELDISEIDITSEIKTHNPFCFDLELFCEECENENVFKFEIKNITEEFMENRKWN